MDFLSTLSAQLGSSKMPWKLHKEGSNMTETLQFIVDKVYPRLGYVIMQGDKIYTMVSTALLSIYNELILC